MDPWSCKLLNVGGGCFWAVWYLDFWKPTGAELTVETVAEQISQTVKELDGLAKHSAVAARWRSCTRCSCPGRRTAGDHVQHQPLQQQSIPGQPGAGQQQRRQKYHECKEERQAFAAVYRASEANALSRYLPKNRHHWDFGNRKIPNAPPVVANNQVHKQLEP